MLTNKTVLPILPVVDLPRARAFYEERLGLKPEADGITDTGVVDAAGQFRHGRIEPGGTGNPRALPGSCAQNDKPSSTRWVE
jgi:catechol 2,3-dioxygenase-like lactoylglutathione lyase family enzyme